MINDYIWFFFIIICSNNHTNNDTDSTTHNRLNHNYYNNSKSYPLQLLCYSWITYNVSVLAGNLGKLSMSKQEMVKNFHSEHSHTEGHVSGSAEEPGSNVTKLISTPVITFMLMLVDPTCKKINKDALVFDTSAVYQKLSCNNNNTCIMLSRTLHGSTIKMLCVPSYLNVQWGGCCGEAATQYVLEVVFYERRVGFETLLR